MAKQKCAKCNKEMLYFTLVLMMGPQGFRRYAVCDKCKEKIEKASKRIVNENHSRVPAQD